MLIKSVFDNIRLMIFHLAATVTYWKPCIDYLSPAVINTVDLQTGICASGIYSVWKSDKSVEFSYMTASQHF